VDGGWAIDGDDDFVETFCDCSRVAFEEQAAGEEREPDTKIPEEGDQAGEVGVHERFATCEDDMLDAKP
jgi:hypothetical protein